MRRTRKRRRNDGTVEIGGGVLLLVGGAVAVYLLWKNYSPSASTNPSAAVTPLADDSNLNLDSGSLNYP